MSKPNHCIEGCEEQIAMIAMPISNESYLTQASDLLINAAANLTEGLLL